MNTIKAAGIAFAPSAAFLTSYATHGSLAWYLAGAMCGVWGFGTIFAAIRRAKADPQTMGERCARQMVPGATFIGAAPEAIRAGFALGTEGHEQFVRGFLRTIAEMYPDEGGPQFASD